MSGRVDKFLGVFIPDQGDPIPLAEYEKRKAAGKSDKDEKAEKESKKDKGGKDE